MEEHASGFVVYCLEKNEPLFLLLRSSRNGFWGLPKGRVDAGETDGQAARRELMEETGIEDYKPDTGFERTIRYTFSREGELVNKTARYFLARVKFRQASISTEHSEFGWYALEQAKERIAFENLYQVVVEAYGFIKER